MPMRRRTSLALVAAASWTVAPARESAATEDVPLPLTGKQIVRPIGKRYVLDGKQVIPSGSAIRIEANVKVFGLHGASLDVRGGLKVHGVPDSRVEIHDVDFSPTVAPIDEVHLDEVELIGCTFRHGKDAQFTGGFTVENAHVTTPFDFHIKSGFVRLMSTTFDSNCTVTGFASTTKAAEVAVRTCTLGTLRLVGPSAGTVRDCTIRQQFVATEFTDLVVDATDLSGSVSFLQTGDGSFAKLSLLNCNLLD